MNKTKVHIIPSHEVILPKECNSHDVAREPTLGIRQYSSPASSMMLQGIYIKYQIGTEGHYSNEITNSIHKSMTKNSVALNKMNRKNAT